MIFSDKAEKNNVQTLSNEYFYVINNKNGLIYYSGEKGICLEYVVDSIFTPDDKGIFIYESDTLDFISLVYINSINKTVTFAIKKEGSFSTKKLENFLKVICLKDKVFQLYFFESSSVEKSLVLPSFFSVNYINRASFKKAFKKSKKLKNSQNKIISLVVFCAITIACEVGMTKALTFLKTEAVNEFNTKNKSLEIEKTKLLESLKKYDDLSISFKDIQVVKSKDEYLKAQIKEVQ